MQINEYCYYCFAHASEAAQRYKILGMLINHNWTAGGRTSTAVVWSRQTNVLKSVEPFWTEDWSKMVSLPVSYETLSNFISNLRAGEPSLAVLKCCWVNYTTSSSEVWWVARHTVRTNGLIMPSLPPWFQSRARAAGKKHPKKRGQRATSNIFAMFDQAQIQEFKEVSPPTHAHTVIAVLSEVQWILYIDLKYLRSFIAVTTHSILLLYEWKKTLHSVVIVGMQAAV